MENVKKISAGEDKDIIFSQSVKAGKRIYYIDVKNNRNNDKFLTITESKNGAGAVPIKTEKGWIHIAHGVRNTAAGLRYVIYAFATALDDPFRVIAAPSGYLLAPQGADRIGDVSDVVFTNGAIVRNSTVYLYYGASDTRVNVVTMEMERLVDYVFSTPSECFNTFDSVEQRMQLIRKNKKIIKDREKR